MIYSLLQKTEPVDIPALIILGLGLVEEEFDLVVLGGCVFLVSYDYLSARTRADEAESQALIDELTAFCTQPRYVYSHRWSVGDVLLWDQRAVLHRGTPWPYEQPRKLSSICSSVKESDGLCTLRIATEPA